jgi:hypothetical protein
MIGEALLRVLASCAPSADAGAAAKPAPPGCQPWLKQTVTRIEKLPEQKWRDAIVAALADACPDVPEALRKGARDVRTIKEAGRRDRLLADAAASVLGMTCSVTDPMSDSRELAARCPLPARPELQLSSTVLGDVRAVDYLIVDALATRLLAARQYDAHAERLMMDFLLSAGLRGEAAQKHRR